MTNQSWSNNQPTSNSQSQHWQNQTMARWGNPQENDHVSVSSYLPLSGTPSLSHHQTQSQLNPLPFNHPGSCRSNMRQGSEKRRETGRLSRSIGSASIDEDAPGEPEEDENDFMNPAEPSEVDPNKSTLQHRTPSNPRNSLLLLDHSHTQQHSTTIPGPENPIDDEVNHDLLRKMFSLTINEAGVAREILQMSPANQQAAIVYSAISSHGKASQTQASSSDVHPIGVTKVQKIRLGDLIKTLMECKLDTYSLEHDTNTGEIIAASLLRMTNRFIAELSLHDKKSLLPTGFIDQNQAVLQAVREQIHETIKSEKGTLRGCVRSN
ncbi:hypothetical protein PGTUg99_005921 [Puccinia graminis f. sp. tritici]|uniref:Uncharacterized protein n=1 Tax=Puccinia graminis f. sp. tritici TaxID=56615 RepID=A0A5B0MR73_PUCGR|nr:hypothetical protein PGTUg99_005921 [Puccinia graminis f. sp. tritici]